MYSLMGKNISYSIVLKLLLLHTFACDFDETMNQMLDSYKDCTDYNETEFWMCLQNESISILDRAEDRLTIIPLIGDSVSLIKDKSFEDTFYHNLALRQTFTNKRARKLSTGDIAFSISKTLLDFFKSRSLQIKIPLFLPDVWSTYTEGRAKKDKGYSALAGVLLMGLMMSMGSLAMLAGKALMTSLIALTLTALSHRRGGYAGLHSGATTYEVINVPGHHH